MFGSDNQNWPIAISGKNIYKNKYIKWKYKYILKSFGQTIKTDLLLYLEKNIDINKYIK